MKIIKQGTPPSRRVWKGVCTACKSEALAYEEELNNINYDWRDGDPWSWEKCPICGTGGHNEYGEVRTGGMCFHPTDETMPPDDE